MRSSDGHQRSNNLTGLIYTKAQNCICNRHVVLRDHNNNNKNDTISYHRSFARSEYTLPTEPNLKDSKTVQNYNVNQQSKESVYASSYHHLPTRLNPHSELMSELSAKMPHRQNASINQTPWSDIDDIVFADDNDNDNIINSQSFGRFGRDTTDASSVANNYAESQMCQEDSHIYNDQPIKGILKSSSQSSYSSSNNENSSEGETPASTNSQKSSELLSNESKSSSKKKVHFEERVVTKIIFPFGGGNTHTHSVGSLYHDTGQLLAINNLNIQSDYYNYTNSEDGDMIGNDDRNVNLNRQRDHTHYAYHWFGNHTEHSNDVRLKPGSVFDELRNMQLSNNINDYHNGSIETGIVPSNNYIPSNRDFQVGSMRKFSPENNFISHDFRYATNNVMNGNGTIVREDRSTRRDECVTAFPYRPSFKHTHTHSHLDTTVAVHKHHGRTPPSIQRQSQSDRDNHKWSNNSSIDKQLIDFSRVKFLQTQSLSPEDKTRRILEWLDDVKVKANGRPARRNSLSMAMMPRSAVVRRSSFVGV